MRHSNPYWRNDYYVAHLDLVLGVAGDLEKQRRSSSSLLSEEPATGELHATLPSGLQFSYPSNNVPFDPGINLSDAKPSSFQGLPEAVYFNHLASSVPTTSSSNSPLILPTRLSAYTATSLDLMSIDHPSSAEESSTASSDSTASFSRCGLCDDKEFNGTLESQKRSLRRHVKAVHNGDPRLSCPIPRCGKTFTSGRPDNVRRHIEKQHPNLHGMY